MSSWPLVLAIQKKGRLRDATINLISAAFTRFPDDTVPLQLVDLRDDDIPRVVSAGYCDVGIVGSNVLAENTSLISTSPRVDLAQPMPLGFSPCRLSIAAPEHFDVQAPSDLEGARIATSYPALLSEWLLRNNVHASVQYFGGQVERIAEMGWVDAICDLVATGASLRAAGLREVARISDHQAVAIRRPGRHADEYTARLWACLERSAQAVAS